ncbi:phage-related antirepressor [Secundilactobacillus pentosiphilus]|uniref:Phage-related antirepressor n=1 Tax=Secundilactobacillus pentosiphilus TaxID=1714682 RepID=A0A1Z5IZC1_9LACO|nr:phage regulatory protein/antirepressor Ant [Secundilactobacillus pentosiphilus]GAX06986.1 phage-related antirepressor [Secundilactobacillus pentosiphilus]
MAGSSLVSLKEKQVVTSSLNVAKTFGKQHKHVLEAIDNLVAEISATKSSSPKLRSQMFAEGTYINRGKRYRQIFMNRDGFTLLAMGFTGYKATNFKLEYIEAFNSMEKTVATKAKDSYMIDDPVERAKRWIEEQRKTKELEEENTSMQPKAVFADAVAVSHTTILVGELAKLLKQNGIDIGQRRLFTWLRENGYLIKRKGTDWNMPTQRSMEMELFEIKEGSFAHSDGHTSITKTVKVTGKGQQYFINKFLNMSA